MSVDTNVIQALKDVATRLRIYSVQATSAANSGHPTSCSSMADVMAVLFMNVMKYKVSDPRHPSNDRFVLSKGHAAPILYAAWAEAGLFDTSELQNLRKLSSDLEGHPTPRLSFVDVATGSLGQGLNSACGMAYTGKYFDKASFRVYVLLGDGESAEGSNWEAMSFAAFYKLDNLVAIIDVNRLGQSQATPLQHDLDVYKDRVESFGWNAMIVDGHDIGALLKLFDMAKSLKGKPTCLIARTFKGQDFPAIQDKENWHGKPLGTNSEAVIKHLQGLLSQNAGGDSKKLIPPAPIEDCTAISFDTSVTLDSPPNYEFGQAVATRAAYGTALVKIAKNNKRVIGIDGDVKNSTFSIKLTEAFPERFIECFIAEQNMVGIGIGCSTRNRTIPFVSTFAAFFTRAADHLRVGAISFSNCNFVGSHAGISIGEDGPSQMALEDLALFRAIPNCTVFYPSDAVSTERAVELAANTTGMCFIRTGRPNCAVIYSNEECFQVGKGKVVRSSPNDVVTVVGAGVTLFEALKAADLMQQQGIGVRVVDPFTIKPIDADLLIKCAKETGGNVVTVEDHYPEGGLGDAVQTALRLERNVVVERLAVQEVPRSGKCDELMAKYKINAHAIIEALKKLI